MAQGTGAVHENRSRVMQHLLAKILHYTIVNTTPQRLTTVSQSEKINVKFLFVLLLPSLLLFYFMNNLKSYGVHAHCTYEITALVYKMASFWFRAQCQL